mgnify:CR=1 FL=1
MDTIIIVVLYYISIFYLEVLNERKIFSRHSTGEGIISLLPSHSILFSSPIFSTYIFIPCYGN